MSLSPNTMDDLAKAFNNLPRFEKTDSGISNHWYFCVRHVPLPPAGDLLHLVNSASHFVHTEGPKQISPMLSPSSQADIIVPLLLEAFLSGIDKYKNVGSTPGVSFKFAPWSWATKNADLAKAIEDKLKAIGVKPELCTVRVGNKADEDASNETWREFQRIMMTMMCGGSETCNGCKKNGSSIPNGLKRCGRCGWAWYCSGDCQKADWNNHKKTCGPPPIPSTGSSVNHYANIDPFTYYNIVAGKVHQAQALASLVHLTLPAGGASRDGLLMPIRRLIVTGKDTPENMTLLLGPNWKNTVLKTYEEARLEVLINPPPGSPSYAIHFFHDKTSPWFSPRPATAAENERLQRIRVMQNLIRRYLGPRKEPTSHDMTAILSNFGSSWDRALPDYQLATNTMDQGVQLPPGAQMG